MLVPLRYVIAGLLVLFLLRLFGGGLAPGKKACPSWPAWASWGLPQPGRFTVGLADQRVNGSSSSPRPAMGSPPRHRTGAQQGSWRGALGLGLAVVGVALVVGAGWVRGTLRWVETCWLLERLLVGRLHRALPARVAAFAPLFVAAGRCCWARGDRPAGPDRPASPSPSHPWRDSVGLTSWAAASTPTVLASGFPCLGQRLRLGANRVLAYLYLVTRWLDFGVLLLGEDLGAQKVAGAAVILLGYTWPAAPRAIGPATRRM